MKEAKQICKYFEHPRAEAKGRTSAGVAKLRCEVMAMQGNVMVKACMSAPGEPT